MATIANVQRPKAPPVGWTMIELPGLLCIRSRKLDGYLIGCGLDPRSLQEEWLSRGWILGPKPVHRIVVPPGQRAQVVAVKERHLPQMAATLDALGVPLLGSVDSRPSHEPMSAEPTPFSVPARKPAHRLRL